MSACSSCGSGLGFLRSGPWCAPCEARAVEAARAAVDSIRNSGGTDAQAEAVLAGLFAAEESAAAASHPGAVRTLAEAAADAVLSVALRSPDPVGAADALALGVAAQLLPGDRWGRLALHLAEFRIRAIARGEAVPNADAPVVMGPGETCLVTMAAGLLESVQVRGTRGGYGGTTVRVAKGVSMRVGAFGAQSSLQQVQMRHIDDGQLVLTTSRLVFLGKASTIEIDRREIISLARSEGGFLQPASITVHVKKGKPVGFTLPQELTRLAETALSTQAGTPGSRPTRPATVRTTARPAPQAKVTATCRACGSNLGDAWLYCPSCNSPIPSSTASE